MDEIAAEHVMSASTLLPFQSGSMTPARLAAVSYLARYPGHTHTLYAYQRALVRLVPDRRVGPAGRD